MSTVVVRQEYADVLTRIGDPQQAVDEALKRYTTQKIGQQIAALRRQIQQWEGAYGCSFERFYARVISDEDYVSGLRHQHPLWERDLQQWEFYVGELNEWMDLEQFLHWLQSAYPLEGACPG